jgi:hypothetical protein
MSALCISNTVRLSVRTTILLMPSLTKNNILTLLIAYNVPYEHSTYHRIGGHIIFA